MDVKELDIPVPWGIIAAKAWGDEKDQPVVVLHGYQDNAGSFDTLIPLLPNTYYYICIDMPSHGRSTHFPTPTFITFFDFVVGLKKVLDYFNRKRYILMGHSYGAQTALTLTQMFPEYVIKLIMLDAFSYLPLGPERVYHEYRGIITLYEKQLSHANDKFPTYTREAAVQRLMDSRFAKITKKSAEILLDRSLIPVGDGLYKISSAQHLKRPLRAPFGSDVQVKLLENFPVLCPILLVMAKNSRVYIGYKKAMERFVKKKKHYILKVVEGDHDVHLENPESVAPIITKFLLKEFHSKL